VERDAPPAQTTSLAPAPAPRRPPRVACTYGAVGAEDLRRRSVEPEDPAHGRVVASEPASDGAEGESLGEELSGLTQVDWMRSRSAEAPPLRPGTPQTRDHAVTDEIPLELGERRQHVEEQPPRRRRGVDRLIEHYKVDPEGLELGRQRHEVPRTAHEAVQLRDQDEIELPQADVGQQRVELGTPLLRAAHAVIDELRDSPAAALGDCVTCPKSCPNECAEVRFGASRCDEQKKTATETLKIPRRSVWPRSL